MRKVPAGLREKKRLSRPAGTLFLGAWERKRANRGSGKEKTSLQTRRRLIFHVCGNKKEPFTGLEIKNQRVRPEKRLVSGLREEKRHSRPAGTLFSCVWERKRANHGSGNEKPVRETRKEIGFGSVREKVCRQTRRKPKRNHVSQKNRRLYAKNGSTERKSPL